MTAVTFENCVDETLSRSADSAEGYKIALSIQIYNIVVPIDPSSSIFHFP
jgi:hypothetical protein